MHRTNCVPRTALGGMLLALVLSGAQVADAQEPAPPPAPLVPGERPTIVVPINGTRFLQMTTKKNIARAINPNEKVASVSRIVGDPTRVLITGLQAGATRVTLTDVDGKEETYDIVVQMDPFEYLRTLLQRGVPKANIQVIPGANNTVILQGNVEHAEDIDTILRIAQSVFPSNQTNSDQIINRLRVGGPVQVQLDVTVARVSRSEFRRMAFAFDNKGMQHFFASTLGLNNVAGANQTVSVTSATGSLTGNPGNLFLGVINSQQSFFGFLQALRDENIVKLMAEPKLVTLSGRPAKLLSGGQQAVPVVAGLGGTAGVDFKDFGTRLNFLPIVLGDGRIHLEVEPEVSNLDPASGVAIPGGGFVPGRSTQSVRTTVELETGQTFIIGGLIQRNVRGTIQKVPILGDLPFFGTAFSRKNYEEVEEELVVMVTPYLVDALACNQVPKFLPGQETRSPDDFELFLEGILEAPRGQRYACQAGRYVPAHRTGPTAELFPCFNGCNGPYGGVCGPEGCVPGTPAGATMGGGTAPAAASSGARPVADEPPVRSLPDPVTIPANPSGDGERQP